MDYDPKCGIIASMLEALVFLALVFTLVSVLSNGVDWVVPPCEHTM